MLVDGDFRELQYKTNSKTWGKRRSQKESMDGISGLLWLSAVLIARASWDEPRMLGQRMRQKIALVPGRADQLTIGEIRLS